MNCGTQHQPFTYIGDNVRFHPQRRTATPSHVFSAQSMEAAMRSGEEPLNMIKEEINETERGLQFWQQQEQAQTGTQLGKRITAIVDG